MDWQGLSRRIAADHPHKPQILGRCEVAIASAREALQILASHGYHFHLAEGNGSEYPKWPRKLYHVDTAPNGILVYNEKEAEELGPGWFDTLQKAQFWDGMERQFQGRGGIPRSPRVPAPIFGLQTSVDPAEAADRATLIAAFKALHSWEKPEVLADAGDSSGEADAE